MRESCLPERFHNVIGVRAEEEVSEKRFEFFCSETNEGRKGIDGGRKCGCDLLRRSDPWSALSL